LLKNNVNKLFIPFLLLLLFSCQAPRNNPLDPLNPDNKLTAINGSVKTLSLPHQPIKDVEVIWKNEKRMTLTDGTGSFIIDNLTAKNGWMYFRIEGYKTDSVYISWNGKKHSNIQQYLNVLPTLDSLIFSTTIINRTPNIQILELVAQARINDADNDIDTVFLVNEPLDYTTSLIYNSDAAFYERKHISMANLGITSPEDVIGREFKLVVKDKYGSWITVSQVMVSRIIKEEIELLSPVGYEVVPPMPTLIWKPFTPGFNYQVKAEIFNRDAPDFIVWEKDDISSAVSSVFVNEELPPATYFWVAWAVDEFQNRCRSKAKNFKVE
jgi:hypothetical protein